MTREEAIRVVKSATVYTPKEMEALETLIPELRESEDEGIRKEIISLIEYEESRGNIPDAWHQAKRPGVWITYLEKLKEQKSRIDACGFPLRDEGESACSYLERCLAPDMRNVWYEACSEIREKQKEQKSAEWSEKDVLQLKAAIEICESSGHTITADWLKSLRPSWKPSEQEKGALRTAIFVLTDERNFPKTAAQLQNILDAFEGKESRKDWKPSEEQMEALKEASASWMNARMGNVKLLKSLYEQLKAL